MQVKQVPSHGRVQTARRRKRITMESGLLLPWQQQQQLKLMDILMVMASLDYIKRKNARVDPIEICRRRRFKPGPCNYDESLSVKCSISI